LYEKGFRGLAHSDNFNLQNTAELWMIREQTLNILGGFAPHLSYDIFLA